jgi:hypothetical protein
MGVLLQRNGGETGVAPGCANNPPRAERENWKGGSDERCGMSLEGIRNMMASIREKHVKNLMGGTFLVD